MKISTRTWRRIGLGLLALVVAGLAVRFWVVPAIIRGQLQARYGGFVTFRGWWLDRSSAGVKDLQLGEGPGRSSPIWARAARVETDLSFGKILRDRFLPDRISLERPEIVFRIAADGRLLTRPPLKGGAKAAAVPDVVVRGGRVTLAQEGRGPMTVGPVRAKLATAEGGEVLSAGTDDPFWGRWTASGRFDEGFASGGITLRSDGPLEVTADKIARIPFVPISVWEHVNPRGPVAIALAVTTGEAPRIVTTCEFRGARLQLPTLGLVAEGATGTMTVDGRVVRLSGLKGASIGGTVAAGGTLDFGQDPPRFDLDLDLDGVDVARTPKSWHLAEGGLTGRLTGKVRLLIALTKAGADLSGSQGDAVVEGGTIGGVPVKSLKIAMKAEGEDLKYETKDAASPTSLRSPTPPGQGAGVSEPHNRGPWFGSLATATVDLTRRWLWIPAWQMADGRWQIVRKPPGSAICHLPSAMPESIGGGWLGPLTLTLSPGGRGDYGIAPLLDYGIVPLLIGLQTPPKPAPPRQGGGFVLPKALSTEVEFADVDLVEVLARLHALGIPLPFPIAGRLSLKAKATIPLGALRDVKAYAFHGQAVLKGASIDGVDLGDLRATVALENGVLDLTDFRGLLVDRPEGDAAHPPAAGGPVATEGPLPVGGFRGRLHAEISPAGRLEAHFEGNALPIGELAAPALPHPTPLSGAVSFGFDAGADVARLDDLASWTLSGRADAAKLRYRDTTLDRIAAAFSLKEGRLEVPDLEAELGGQPLRANLGLDVRAPHAFEAGLDVAGWDLDAALAFVPAFPRPAPIGGRLTAATKARGTLLPLDWSIEGRGDVAAFRAGPVAFGDLPVRWRTEGDTLLVAIAETRPLGGTIAAEAQIPTRGDRPITGSAALRGIDVSAASRLMPGGAPVMAGRVDGRGTFSVRPRPKQGEAALSGELTVSAPDLTVRGVATRNLKAVLSAGDGNLRYDLYAEGLGGKMQVAGDVPLGSGFPAEVDGSLRAVGFRLQGLWKPLGLGGAVASLDGLAAIDANLRARLNGSDLRARGVAEVRNLKWGADYPLGTLKGNVTLAPDGWRVDRLSGDVLGGIARGSAVARSPERGPRRVDFNLDVDRASLPKSLAFLPALAARVEGTGSLRLVGGLADSLRAGGEFEVASAKLFDVPLSDLRAPADLQYAPNGGLGSLNVRRWSGRFAGGRIAGDVRFGIGNDRTFATETQLSAVDVESLARALTDARRPASGKVSGKITVGGDDPGRVEGYRGRIDLDLDAASLVELPVFREIERSLGSARGGTFDDGDLRASIANRQVVVEGLTLEGRLVQLHATGTVGFDTRLDLEVLVNTNQIIGQTGQALVGLIPGLADAVGRRNLFLARLSNYLQNRLLKFRVTGTIASPSVSLDPAMAVTEGAVGFFAGALKLPLELIR